MRLTAQGARVQALALSADDRVLVSASDNGAVQTWDFATGALLQSLQAHAVAVTGVAVSADGRTVLSGSSDRTLCVWDCSTGAVRHLRGHEAGITAVDLSPDGQFALSGSSNRVMNAWRIADGVLLGQVAAHADAIHALRFSRSSDWAASASADRGVRLWRLSELAAERPREQHDGPVCALAFSPDGSLCASGGNEGGIKVWEVASGRCVATLGVGTADMPIRSLAFTPDAGCLVSGSVGGAYRLWLIDSGEQIWMPVRHAAPVHHGVFSANARYLVTSCSDRFVYFWDVSSGALISRLGTRRLFDHLISPSAQRARLATSGDWLDTYLQDEPLYHVRGIALSVDGRFAAICAQPEWRGKHGDRAADSVVILVLDIDSGAIETVSTDQSQPIVDVAIDVGGVQVAWAGADHTLRLWRPDTQHLYEGHKDRVRGVALASRRGLLVSCSMDRSVRAWRLADASPVASLTGDSPMHVLALSPDESVVAVGDQQGRVHMLGLDESASSPFARRPRA
jgi:WD40 repeat protein